MFLYSVIQSFKNAYQVLFKEKRLGVDVLDALVVLACLLKVGYFLSSRGLFYDIWTRDWYFSASVVFRFIIDP